jgi:hypothetical protein
MTWITLWRPPRNHREDDGRICKDNEVHVFIDKAKPKGTATRGMCRLFFDWKKNRYYEEAWGNDYYAYEQKPLQLITTQTSIDLLPEVPPQPEELTLPF